MKNSYRPEQDWYGAETINRIFRRKLVHPALDQPTDNFIGMVCTTPAETVVVQTIPRVKVLIRDALIEEIENPTLFPE